MLSDFPEFLPVTLETRDFLQEFFSRQQPAISEFTFTNLFGWREVNNYQAALYRGGVLFLREIRGRLAILPCGLDGPARAVDEVLDWFRQQGRRPLLEAVGEELALQLVGIPGISVREDRDNFDYIYLTQELIDLKGEKFHGKKNLLNQFRDQYPGCQYHSLTEELVDRALRFQHEWCAERDCEKDEGLSREKCAVFRMLENFGALKTGGAVIEIDGRIVALTLGEPLNADTFVIHVEKARAGIIGLYQAINRDFLADQAAAFKYVNREQDLGVTGLRRAKMSYNPVRLVKKYRIEENAGVV